MAGPVGARFGALASVVVAATVMVTLVASPAEARRRYVSKGGGYNPPYADMVVDAKTGRVLHAVNEDALRHPASVTKVMTLYLLFEQLEKGRFSLDSELRVSAHSQSMAPSKLGLRAGQTIEVEDAIKALVTKSANDVAATVAENIGGSEDAFADMMTRKARQLGMNRTVYKNASGLPDPGQVTTARDLVTLGRAIQDRFPRYYTYFRTPSFSYAGASHRNHNRLMSRVEGMDGIKTGYTRLSGFNLLTSVKTEGRHVVAVVLGGRSASARDNQMAALLDDNIERAYAGARTAPVVGEGSAAASVASADDDAPATTAVVSTRMAPKTDLKPTIVAVAPPAAAPVAPVLVAAAPSTTPTASGRPVVLQAASIAPAAIARPAVASASGSATTTPSSSSGMKWVVGAKPDADTRTGRAETKAVKVAKVEARPEPKAETKAEMSRVPKSAQSGWVIQLGATDDEAKAKKILQTAKSKSKLLVKADPFTEKVSKGGSTLYRARFSGFDEEKATSACKSLQRTGFSCFAVRGG